MRKEYDRYELITNDENLFLKELEEMEQHTVWKKVECCRDLFLSPLDNPLLTLQQQSRIREDDDLIFETMTEGTRQILNLGEPEYCQSYLLRDTAMKTLLCTAGINGSALGKMEPELFSKTVNLALQVAEDSGMLLLRYGKVSAIHSGENGGYNIMSIPKLTAISREVLEKRFGTVRFLEGYHSHGITRCIWDLPDVKDQIVDSYQEALKNAVSNHHSTDIIPAVRFISSDTANSSVFLTPVFRNVSSGTVYQLMEGVKVRHTKRGYEEEGCDVFRKEAAEIYSMFDESMDKIRKMGERPIRYPVNTVVGLCNKLKIPKKYGAAAYETAERFEKNKGLCSEFDVYLALNQCTSIAAALDAGYKTRINLEELMAKALHLNFRDYDIPGIVSW